MSAMLVKLSAVLDQCDGLFRRTDRGLDRGLDIVMQSRDDVLQRLDGFVSHGASLLPYVKFALVGIGLAGLSVAYATCRLLTPIPNLNPMPLADRSGNDAN